MRLSLSGYKRWLVAAALVAALGVLLVALVPGAVGHPFHPGAETAKTRSSKFGGLRLEYVGRFGYPVYVTSPPGDRARQFVVQQSGKINVVKNGQILPQPFLDLSKSISFNRRERGLLSMAFTPDYAKSGLFYVFYTRPNGDLRIDEFKRSSNPDVAAASTRRKVIGIKHRRYGVHNGGQLQFGPDGLLYASTGDGGGSGDPLRNAQDLNSLLGKILRINPRKRSSRGGYKVPADNPFSRRPGRGEIWHYGLRNPWRFSFDRRTGRMSIGDVGQAQREEVNFLKRARKGFNFGWRCFEGTFYRRSERCSAPGHVRPVLEYAHEGGSCAVTGGFVVRDRALPRLAGRYVYGDYCTGALHAASLEPGQRTPRSRNIDTKLVVPRLTGFGEDAQGRIYATSRKYEDRPGAVYMLRAAR
jgi:hypothetical protein